MTTHEHMTDYCRKEMLCGQNQNNEFILFHMLFAAAFVSSLLKMSKQN